MRAQRRDANRKTGESVERMWQVYADHIGLPKAGEGEESPPPSTEDTPEPRRPLRLVRDSVGRPLAGRRFAVVGGVVVVLIAGITLWLGLSSRPDTAARRSQTASAPAGEAERITPRPAPINPGDALQASPPIRAIPSEKTAPSPRPRPAPDVTASRPATAVPPSSGVSRPENRQASRSVSPEAKPATGDVAYRIGFDFGSDYINDQSRRTLDKIAAAMKANHDWRMVIEGHADAQGTPDFNQALSERRAQTVKAYLQAAGVAPGRLSAVGLGASRPVAPNDVSGNALNRRVEFRRQ
jgi:outer membrane protein OmpA-like peptidoglycan-associated protein